MMTGKSKVKILYHKFIINQGAANLFYYHTDASLMLSVIFIIFNFIYGHSA